MAVVRVLIPYVARVIVANPLQVKAIAHARIKTDKIDAGVLASLRAADFLPEIWPPDAADRAAASVGRPAQPGGSASHPDQERGACHPACPFIPPCPHADLFGGRAGMARHAGLARR